MSSLKLTREVARQVDVPPVTLGLLQETNLSAEREVAIEIGHGHKAATQAVARWEYAAFPKDRRQSQNGLPAGVVKRGYNQ